MSADAARTSACATFAVLAVCALAVSGFAAAPAKSATPIKTSAAVRRWMKGMSLRDEVAQLVFIEFHGGSPNTRSRDYQRFVRLIRETKVGGLILNNVTNGRGVQKAEPYALGAFLNRMQRIAKVPLLVGGDFEQIGRASCRERV